MVNVVHMASIKCVNVEEKPLKLFNSKVTRKRTTRRNEQNNQQPKTYELVNILYNTN